MLEPLSFTLGNPLQSHRGRLVITENIPPPLRVWAVHTLDTGGM